MQLLVLGMHRSGTSAVTRLLNLSGAWFGAASDATEANEENPKGFWERKDVRAVCDGLLHAHGLDWWRVAEAEGKWLDPQLAAPFVDRFAAIVTELDDHRPWVIKEPRLCLVASALLATLDDPVIVHVTRDPIEVADSLRRRNDFPLSVGIALWERYSLAAVATSRGLPCAHVRYGDLVHDPVATVASLVDDLAGLGVTGLVAPRPEDVNEFVASELHRERRSPTARPGLLNGAQAALSAAIDDGTYLDGSHDHRQLSEGALDILTAFEQHRATEAEVSQALSDVVRLHSESADAERRIGELVDEVAAERARAELAETTTAETSRMLESLRSSADAALDDVASRLDGVAASRPWRVASRTHRAVRRLRGQERFDLDHLGKARRDLATVRGLFIGAPVGVPVADPDWAWVETLPSGRTLRHTRPATRPTGRPKLAVLAWDVGHNPLGRAHSMAGVLAEHFDVEIWGAQFPRYGNRPWAPLRDATIPLHVFDGRELPDHADAMAEVAERIDADVVWVSKPRFPSLGLGALVKQLRNRPLILDVDDHELAFFDVDDGLSIDELRAMPKAELEAPFGRSWTQACDRLIDAADLVTVSNVTLQERYGGVIVPHARDETVFDPARFDRTAARTSLGVGPHDRLLLFGGTARVHKGVLEVLEVLETLDDARYRLALFNTKELAEIGALDRFSRWIVPIPPQPFTELPRILAAADLSCVLQDPDHPVARYQLPAKVSDALAMRVPCLVRAVPPLAPLIDAGAVAVHHPDEPLSQTITALFDDPDALDDLAERGRRYYDTHLSFEAVATTLLPHLDRLVAAPPRPDPRLAELVEVASGLGRPPTTPPPVARTAGTRRRDAEPGETYDLVLFWKQNDTGLYGRRSDMLLEHLARSGRFGAIVHFDKLIAPNQLRTMWRESSGAHDQGRLVSREIIARLLRRRDGDGVVARTFLYSGRSKRRFGLPNRSAYPDYVRRVLAANGVGDRLTVFWVWPANPEFPAIVDALQPDLVVADVVDDNRTWYQPGDPMLAEVERNYREILSRSDLVLANCEPVVASMKELGYEASLVPNGCELPDDQPPGPRPASMDLPPGPIVGYVGNLSSRIDIDLLDLLVRRRPQWQFVFIGSAHLDRSILRLDEFENVHFLGVRPYREAKAMLSHFDVAIIPHLDNAMTRSMNPLKAFVYAAAGVPIVSTPVANLSELDELITMASDADEFEAAIEAAISQPQRAPRLDVLEPHSWDRRVSDVLTLIDRAAGVVSTPTT